jgi:hypothetical protein
MALLHHKLNKTNGIDRIIAQSDIKNSPWQSDGAQRLAAVALAPLFARHHATV